MAPQLLRKTAASAAVFLFLALRSLAADIPVSDPVIRPAANWRGPARIASNGSDFLVVWADSPDDFRARRITADGEILDPLGIPIARSASWFAVASDGDGYLVAYESLDETRVVRVERDGTVGTPVSMFPMQRLSLAWNGTSFLLLGDNTTGVNVRALDRGGRPLHPWTTIAPDGMYASAAWNGRQYLVTWWDHPSIQAATFDGTRAGPLLTIGSTLAPPSISSNGDSWLIAWAQWDLTLSGREVHARSVAADGTLGETQVIGNRTLAGSFSALARTGDGYVATWNEAGGTFAALLDDRGAATRPPFRTATAGPATSIAASPSDVWIASREELRFNAFAPPVIEVAAQRLEDPQPRRLAFSAGEQSAPVVDAAGELVAWSEQVGAERKPTLFSARIAGAARSESVVVHPSARQQLAPVLSDGMLFWSERGLDDPATTLFAKPVHSTREPVALGSISSTAPAVVWTGASHFVVWRSNGSLVAARVLPSGDLLDAAPIPLGENGTNPRVAFDGENVLVAWTGATDVECAWHCVTIPTLETRVFSPQGVPVSPRLRLSQGEGGASSVAWNGSEFAVFWIAIGGELKGIRLTRTGAKLGEPRALTRVASAPGAIVAAWTGFDFAVAVPVTDGMRVVRVARDLTSARVTSIDTGGETARPYAIAVRPGGAIAIAYERIFRGEPYGGAQRALLHYEPSRRRAAR
jgi:hypothetical protein